MESDVLSNVGTLISPLIDKLKLSRLDSSQVALVNVLETNVNNIISPFIRHMTVGHFKLTPQEILIANLIKDGRTSKEVGCSHICRRSSLR